MILAAQSDKLQPAFGGLNGLLAVALQIKMHLYYETYSGLRQYKIRGAHLFFGIGINSKQIQKHKKGQYKNKLDAGSSPA
jgi:hypothetical protein